MSIPDASTADVPEDAIESIDEDDNEVIMMDPKNYYMVYLLKISAFLHSSIAFLMMISYYKLKVNDWSMDQHHFDWLVLGTFGHFQTGKGDRSKAGIRRSLVNWSTEWK